ncbi:protein-L-isoaspartate(D-aspartate) O-methyltransferase [bacterium]|nr:protein-L-isoaspartate(D-aspartate) O-methyltransferase [bacterium]
MDFLKLRKEMVDSQLIPRGIRDKNVLNAFLRVPRELFVPKDLRHFAYNDSPVLIGEGQTISQPYIVALMTQALNISKNDKILEIGTGSGYQSAILAEMGCVLYSIEKRSELAQRAEKVLKQLGYNVKIKVGDGTLGWQEFSPYDGIIVTAGGPTMPNSLFNQLREEGRMVIPIGDLHYQELTLIKKVKGKRVIEELGGCRFVNLEGKEGW